VWREDRMTQVPVSFPEDMILRCGALERVFCGYPDGEHARWCGATMAEIIQTDAYAVEAYDTIMARRADRRLVAAAEALRASRR
jgi:hypothetical protein